MALMANDACGGPISLEFAMPWTFFDGKLFHSKLLKATQARNLLELCDGRSEMAFQVEQMRNVILAGLVKQPQPVTRMSHPNAAIWRAPKKGVASKSRAVCNQTLGQKPTFYPEITKKLMFEKCEFCEK